MVVKIEIMKTEVCPFCPQAVQVVNKVAKEFKDKVQVREIYVDRDEKERDRAISLGIMSVPVILINGMPRFTGVPREQMLKEMIEQSLKGND